MKHYNSIIIGAGHNGLVCAAYLARNGQKVLVLEASGHPGGLAAVREFHPGFKASVAHSITHFSAKVAKDLKLAAHGCTFDAPLETVGLNDKGEHVVLRGKSVAGVSDKDREAYAAFREKMVRYAGVLKSAWLKTAPPIGGNTLSEKLDYAQIGLKLRSLGRKEMGEWMRVMSLPARDLMDENFENDLLKAALSWDGLIGAKMAPRSPNNFVFPLFQRMSGEHDGDHVVPKGGIGALVEALHAAATASGAEVRTGARVGRITTRGDDNGLVATGVELEGGEAITADRVISSADPQRTFFDLLGARHLEIEFTNRIRRLRCHGYVAKLHLALQGAPEFTGVEQPDGRMIIAPELDAIEFAFDDAKHGESSENPVMEIMVPSLHDASLAPEGRHVLSAHVMYVPYERKGGWTDEARDALKERILDVIARYAPGLREQVIHAELLTPFDLEQDYNVTGGHWHHAELAMEQMLMMRPTFEAAQYGTPIPGLYLCGAGTHPGGGLMGAPGHNAAREIMK